MADKVRMRRRIAGMLRKRVEDARFDEVPDVRDTRGRRWELSELLRAVVFGISAGSTSLQETEALTEDMSPAMRSCLRVRRRVPDTTVRSALITVAPETLRPSLHAVVRAAHRRKALEPEALPFGVVSLDGKVTALPSCDDHYAQRQSQPDHHLVGLLRTVTTTLTSSEARPCIDLMPIHASTNEMGTFETALRGVLSAYQSLDLFRLVTYDAGACSEHNAAVVREFALHYLFGLKGTQPTLLAEAERLLGSLAPADAVATSSDPGSSKSSIVRRLFLTEEMAAFGSFQHVRTVLRVDCETLDSKGRRISAEQRYFIASLPAARLTPNQWLRVVRGHWGVETSHQILDVAFQEDDHPWISADPKGALVVAVLRRIAYTLLALFRSVSLRSDDQHRKPWRRLLREVLLALTATTALDLAGLRRHAPAPS